MTESCSKLNGALSDISWFATPGNTVDLHGQSVSGYWTAASKSIVLAQDVVLRGSVVRHEMLHALMRDVKGHPRAQFLERCRGVVSCDADCRAEAGPAPDIDANVATVTSDVLEIATFLLPDVPKSTIDGGLFTLVVTATNPKPYPIVVSLDVSGSNKTFFYTLARPMEGIANRELALDPGVTYFSPGETKQQYFDLSLGTARDGRTVRTGSYTLYAGYDIRSITREGVFIGP